MHSSRRCNAARHSNSQWAHLSIYSAGHRAPLGCAVTDAVNLAGSNCAPAKEQKPRRTQGSRAAQVSKCMQQCWLACAAEQDATAYAGAPRVVLAFHAHARVRNAAITPPHTTVPWPGPTCTGYQQSSHCPVQGRCHHLGKARVHHTDRWQACSTETEATLV